MTDSEPEELVFLSPEEEFESKPAQPDPGASPQLRRSSRKRKSTTSYGVDMSKGSSSKKKKSSPSKNKNMPRLPRTPQGQDQDKDNEGGKDKDKDSRAPDVVELLVAMEARLSSKLDANKRAVNEAVKMSKLNSDALDALEEKVDATDEILKETLARVEAQEDRVLARVEQQVKEMVREQLKAAGFDSQLSAGDLSLQKNTQGSYAAVTAEGSTLKPAAQSLNKDQRQEEKFWNCRRALRIWPVPEADGAGLRKFLENKLALDKTFIEQDMGQVVIKRNLEKRPRNKDEICVYFETKQIRDHVKSKGPNLANYRDEAGMRLQIPDHLQKDFKALMSVACLLYTSPSPRDRQKSRMPSSA